MKKNGVLLTGRTDTQYYQLISELSKLHSNSSGSLRLTKKFDAVEKDWVIYLRPRTFSEFLYELIIAWPEERFAIKKEVNDALEHALRPIIAAARAAAYCDSDERLEDYAKSTTPSNQEKASDLNDHDNATALLSNAKAEDGPVVKVDPSEYVATLEELLDSLSKKALGIKSSVDKASLKINTCFASASTKIPARIPHFYITKRPALEFTANNVIVGSVNALSVGKASASRSLKRAFSAFKERWNGAKLECELPKFGKISNDNQLGQIDDDQIKNNDESLKLLISHAALMSVNGLEHIERLVCIADDINRIGIDGFLDITREQSKNFYMAGCESMRGSIVRELYPNRYISDPKNKGALVPFYSDDNIAGAIDAALELTNPDQKSGKMPVSFMFAGLDDITYEEIKKQIQDRPPARPAYNPELPTPVKYFENAKRNFDDVETDEQDSSLLI